MKKHLRVKNFLINTLFVCSMYLYIPDTLSQHKETTGIMTSSFKEIEIKIEVNDAQLQHLTTWLQNHAQLTHKLSHIEWYLDNPSNTFFYTAREGYKDALKYLRVRSTENGDSVAYKEWHKDPITGKTTHCDEWECPVDNGQMMFALFAQLGFTTQTKIAKTRISYKTDDFEIAIDQADKIGNFVEIEVRNPKNNVDDSLNDIYAFLRERGITEFKKQERGYVNMVWNPEYDFSQTIALDTKER